MKIIATCPGCRVQYDLTGWQTGDAVRCRCGGLVIVPEPRAQEARLVRCASCGAVRNKEGASNCEFCGALFSAADKGWGSMCPSCFCRLPLDANYCVECGLKIEPQQFETKAEETLLSCPRCSVPLKQRTLENVCMHECGACAGLWLRAETFEELCRNRDTQTIATRGLGLQHHRTKFEVPENEQVKYIPCPKCRNLMNRHNFASISGVIIDTCKCGVWLDNQELNRIVRFIQDGGLERSREHELHDREMAGKMHTKVTVSTEIILADALNRPRGAGGSLMTDLIVEVAKSIFR